MLLPIRPLRRTKSFEVYQDLATIPSGQSSSKLTGGCLVLEGGAWRGLYTQGALDYLLQQDVNFQSVMGVSAGALSGIGYMSGLIGWGARINLSYRQDPNYVGMGALIQDHGVTGFSFIFNEMMKYYPLDTARVCDPRRAFTAVVTDVETGEPVYMNSYDFNEICQSIQASATVPYVSAPVQINGRLYLDGGCSDNIPYRYALNQGHRKVVVIRTRDRRYRDDINEHRRINHLLYGNHPQFMEKLMSTTARYNEMLDDLGLEEALGNVFVLAPSEPITIGRFEGDMDKLGEVYWLGYHDMEKEFERLMEYLKS